MSAKFCLTEENMIVVENIMNLIEENESDESCFRRCFTLCGIISIDYVLITRSDKPSMYGYFTEKGKKKELKIPRELDEESLEAKLQAAGLQHGEVFFSYAKDYISYAKKYIAPLLEELDSPENDSVADECLQKNPEVGPAAGKDNSQVPGKENPKQPPLVPKPKKPRFEHITPSLIAPEDKKSCLFTKVHEIPKLVLALPSQYEFTDKNMADLQVSCGGTALFGVVTPNHPLYGLPLVCERHKARKFYHIYGPERCPGVYVPTKLPNMKQLCIQGSGGRPKLVEGKVQSNAETLKRTREKKMKKESDLLNSYSQLLEEKEQISMLLDTQQFINSGLQDDIANAQQQYQALFGHASTLAQSNDALAAQLAEKESIIAELSAQNEYLRGQLGM